jgi:hypothetical protein
LITFRFAGSSNDSRLAPNSRHRLVDLLTDGGQHTLAGGFSFLHESADLALGTETLFIVIDLDLQWEQ